MNKSFSLGGGRIYNIGLLFITCVCVPHSHNLYAEIVYIADCFTNKIGEFIFT